MDSKTSIRKHIRQLKKGQSEQNKQSESSKVFQELKQLEQFKTSSVILAYWAMDDEVQTQDFIESWQAEKTFLLPVIDGDSLILKPFEGISSMKENENFNVLEPSGKTYVDIDKIDLIIVPGVAFDKKGNRLGRGKGFYDRLLRFSRAFKIGVGFSFQLINEVPTEAHDIPLDCIITA